LKELQAQIEQPTPFWDGLDEGVINDYLMQLYNDLNFLQFLIPKDNNGDNSQPECGETDLTDEQKFAYQKKGANANVKELQLFRLIAEQVDFQGDR